MVEFEQSNGTLLLRYQPRDDASWVHERLARDKALLIKGTFHLKPEHLVEDSAPTEPESEWSFDEPETVSFQVATLEGEYFVFDRNILAIDCDLLVHKSVQLTYKSFTAEKRVSIFRIIAKLRPGRIVIGGTESDSIPEKDFASLVENFPSVSAVG